MKRVVVLGGLGLFGRTVIEQLRGLGLIAQSASRRGEADLQLDANDAASIRAALRPGDLIIDAAGPFHARTTALIQAAIDVGFDVIDLNDDLSYAESMIAMEPRIVAAGIRVLSSASSVSAVAAAVVQLSEVISPRRVTTFLAPASRHTANSGTALSLLRSVGYPVRVLRDGQLQTSVGWSEMRRFSLPAPVGGICARLFESADAVHLPRIWPSLRDVAMYVDTNTIGVNTLLRVAASSELVRSVMRKQINFGTWLARRFGSSAGGIGYEVEDGNGRVARYSMVSVANSFLTAVAPAVLATRAIADGRFPYRGLISPDRHVMPIELFAFLSERGIDLTQIG